MYFNRYRFGLSLAARILVLALAITIVSCMQPVEEPVAPNALQSEQIEFISAYEQVTAEEYAAWVENKIGHWERENPEKTIVSAQTIYNPLPEHHIIQVWGVQLVVE